MRNFRVLTSAASYTLVTSQMLATAGIHLRLPAQPSGSRLGLLWCVILSGTALAVLVGCGYSGSATAMQVPAGLHGSVHGGQQPVNGASIQIYAAGTNGIRSAAPPLLSNPTKSDSAGNFSVSTSFYCPSASSQLYVIARGGNPGLATGADNPELAMMAMLGSCSSLSASTAISVNEVTTVGSVWPLAGYMKSPDDIGSTAGDANFLAAASSVNEFVNVAEGSSPGVSTTVSPPSLTNVSIPQVARPATAARAVYSSRLPRPPAAALQRTQLRLQCTSRRARTIT
jgi:hypothetical protein